MRSGILVVIGVVALAVAAGLIVWLVRVPNMYAIEGRGEVRYTPDEAEIVSSIYAESAVSVDAVNEAAGTMRQILAAQKAAGVGQNDIKTADVRSGLIDINNERQKPGEPRQYYAEQIVVVTVKDIGHIAKILDAIARAGSNYWLVTYKASNREALEAAARKAALLNAIATADVYARDGNFRRGRVLKIQDDAVTFPSVDYQDREYRTGRSARGYSGRVERVTVTGTRITELPIETTFDVPPPKEKAVEATTQVLFEIE